MTILKILPEKKRGRYQYYEVQYEVHHKRETLVDREKKILQFFDLDKKDFRRILRESLMC